MKNSADEILRRLMEIVGVDGITALSKHYGYSESTLANRLRNGGMPLKEAVQTALDSGESLDWIVFGESRPVRSALFQRSLDNVGDERSHYAPLVANFEAHKLPYYDQRDAQNSAIGRDEAVIYRDIPTFLLSLVGVDAAGAQLLRVRETAMGATVQAGDVVLYDMADQPVDGVCVVDVGGQRLVRRVQRLASGAVRLSADDARFEAETLSAPDDFGFRVVGRCCARWSALD